MREGWINCKLEEITTLVKRGISPKYVDENGVFVINQKCIRDNKVSYFDARLTSKEKKIPEEKFVQIGDTLINSTGTGTLGRTGYVKNVPNPTTVDTHVTIVRPNLNKVEARFLGLFLNFIEPYIENLGKGATNQIELSAKDLSKTQINLPPLETQKKIASILSGYDDLIENNLKRIKILEEMAQQTYEEWFVRMRFPGYESATINSETGLPEGWEKVKLKDCCDLVMGQSPKSEFYNNEKLGIPFHQGVKDYGFRFPINTSWSTAGNKKAKPNSILFSVRAPVGRLNVAAEEIILGRGLAAINHKNGLNSFIFYQLRKIFFEDNLIGGGAIFASVTKSDVERIEFIYNEELANKFNDFASKIDQQILNLTNQNQRLREARDILLPRLMMGMVEV